MHSTSHRVAGLALWSLVALGASADRAAAAPASGEGNEFFEKKVRPVLVEHCFRCHGNGRKKGSLSLQSRDELLKGGDSGPAAVPGRPEASRLVGAVGYKNVDLQMPPSGKLPDGAIRDLAEWVRMGAPWPVAPARAATGGGSFDLAGRKKAHWAWQPVRVATPPMVRDASWPRGEVDRFILARLQEKGLSPAPPADRRTWLRRVTFDLVGLPPTPEEIDAFLADRSAAAEARVVDRLLASPRFGERWARHWLDLVRYAETRGHEHDYTIANAFQYRDYVIRALNADVPYDRFVVEHVAGDLLEAPRRHPTRGFNESVLGTGFWFLGEEVHSPVDVAADEADRFDNRIDILTKTFLGLTVACARCHDHKFDAIRARDYYALYGFLQSSGYRLVRFDTCDAENRLARELAGLREQARDALGRVAAAGARPVATRLADYLLAAREALADTPHVQATDIACQRRLDAALLARWTAHLVQAARNEGDPFHAFARAATEARSWGEVVHSLAEAGRRHAARVASALRGAEVVIDYAARRPEDWMADGGAFGAGPVRPGDIRLEGTPGRPTYRVVERDVAEVDPLWPRLRVAAGSENDPGALGGMWRAGRTLRTPSFTVGPGRVWYLVRGAGQAYASVHSHVMIAGPLHAGLVMGLQTGSWQWVGHDLSRYRGCRAHIEFTPHEGADFAVAMVVQAPVAPPLAEPTVPAVLDLLALEAASPESLAAGYQRLLEDVLDSLAHGHRPRDNCARMAGWLLQRLDLFDADGELAHRVAATAGPFVAEQARLLGALRVESRLAPAMLDGSGRDGREFIRGSAKAPGEVVPRRFLEALAGPDALAAGPGSGRLALARQITDPARNPLLARVLVNRVWHHAFGRGIVASVDNFGALGVRPTHPELLDWLAHRFVGDGWSIKRLVRLLVLSQTYRMSSADTAAEQEDPQNLLLHRMNVRRLEGEAIRDALLAVSGRLDARMYGPPVLVHLTEFQQGRGRPPSGPLDGDGRRSVYLAVRRNFLSPLLLAFDTPIPFSTVGRRSVSNVPAQALILMNDPLVHQQAGQWARRVLAEAGTPRERVTGMYLRAFARPATAVELRRCLDFLDRQARVLGCRPVDEAAWADLAHAMVNTKEFLFLH
jgi:cytochrome c553